MKKLTNTENIERYLQSGKKLRQHQAKVFWNAERLAPIVARLKHRGMWIINIGEGGKHANYLAFECGIIKNLEIDGFTFYITDAYYELNSFSDMFIDIQAMNGRTETYFTVQSEAFRDKKVMKKALMDSLN